MTMIELGTGASLAARVGERERRKRGLGGVEHVCFQERAGGEGAGGAVADDLREEGGGEAGAGALGHEIALGEDVVGGEGTCEDEALAADAADVVLDGEDVLAGAAAELFGG